MNGPSIYVHDRAFEDEDRKNVFAYFVPVTPKYEPEQEIKYQSISIPSANLVAYALEVTQRQKVDIQFERIEENAALSILFSAYKNTNLKSKQLRLGKHVSLCDHVDSGDDTVIYANCLKINAKSLSPTEAAQLINIINAGEFSSIEIAIEMINEGYTLALLGIIEQNPFVQHIDIKIPRYNVNDLGALRAFLAKPLVQLAGADGDDEIASLDTLLQRMSVDLNEFGAAAQASYASVMERSSTFLQNYVVGPAVRFLAEDDPTPEIGAQVQHAAGSQVRQSLK